MADVNMADLSHKVFTERTFFGQFERDLKSARALVLIHSPFATIRRVEYWREALLACARRNVRVCAFIQEPRDWKQHCVEPMPDMMPFEGALKLLSSTGTHCNLRPKAHEKVYVIDDRIVWEGGLNALSHFDTTERINRWEGEEKVREVIASHKLDACGRCHARTAFSFKADPLKRLGCSIARYRELQGLSQRELAELTGVSRTIISGLERGQRNVEASTLRRIYEQLRVESVIVPQHFMPAIGDFVGGDGK